MRLYKRSVQVIIGDEQQTNNAIEIPKDPTKDQLKIKFSVSLNQASSLPSDNYVHIYNLSDTTQSFVKERGTRIRILAGYDGNLFIIYDGSIDKVEIKTKDTDVVTKIILSSKSIDITSALFSKSYIGLTNSRQIIKDAIEGYTKIGFSNQYLDLVPEIPYLNFSFSGRLKDLFNNILKPLGLMWYVDGDTIRFTVSGSKNGNTVTNVNETNGMIGSPTKTDKGVKVKMLLNGNIVMSDLINIQSDSHIQSLDGRKTNQLKEEYKGQYKVISITHKGDTIDSTMLTTLEAVLINV